MTPTPTREAPALWADLEENRRALLPLLTDSTKRRNLKILGSMERYLRRYHWSASFLGLPDLAEIAALGAAFVKQLQNPREVWSKELAIALKSLISRMAAFEKNRADENVGGVFTDVNEAVLQGPVLQRPIPTADLVSLFRRRQIDPDVVSGCRSLAVGKDEDFSHAITIPAGAMRRHRTDRWLSLVYLDVEKQEVSHAGIITLFEEAFRRGEILLHGSLEIPWKKWRDGRYRRPYYLVVDTLEEPALWLEKADLDGRVVKTIRRPAPSAGATAAIPAVPISYEETFAEPVEELAPLEEAGSVGGAVSAGPPEPDRPRRRKRPRISNKFLKVRFPVGAKLILIISMIIIAGLTGTTSVSLYFFSRDTRARLEESNLSLSEVVVGQADSEILGVLEAANLLFQFGAQSGTASEALVTEFFANYRSLVYVGIPGSGREFGNRVWLRDARILDETAILRSIFADRARELDRARGGETVIFNASPYFPNAKSPVLGISVPFALGISAETLTVLVDVSDTLALSVASRGLAETVIVNANGEILAHPDIERVLGGASLAGSPVFTEMYSLPIDKGQIQFNEEIDGRSVAFLGSFAKIPTGNLGVVTTVRLEVALEPIRRITQLNILFALTLLFLAVLGTYLFAQSLSIPIKELALASRQIKAGNYHVELEPRTRDEVGVLTGSFLEMARGLEEGERVKDALGSTQNPMVAEMAAKGELPEQGLRKVATVFFSDIRGFTSMSEKLGDPHKVIVNLNEYFDAMVPCIEKTRGITDKYIGDAIMAVWGGLVPMKNHAESGVNGALMMRDALIKFNRGRGSSGKPRMQIGCGLNSGPVIVGPLGTSTKWEFGHIGDAVNLASRIEGLNKPMGTDILISQSTAEMVEGIFELVPMNKIRVKGKREPQQIYAVLGRSDDPSRPRSLEELRRRVGILGEFGKVADAEEKETKYEILDS